MLMKTPTEMKYITTDCTSNHEILSSIRAHGLVSPHKIRHVLSNQTAQSNSVNGCICVNYVNLKDASLEEKNLAYAAAFDEEYLGVSGISLERNHPLQRVTNPEISHQEIQQRIMHQVVFVLAPPKISPRRMIVHEGKSPAEFAFYSSTLDDGFSQAREKSVFTNQNVLDCNRVTEIKTSVTFESKDMIAILAPEFLYDMCRSVFSDIEIISINSSKKTLKCLPKMLQMCFDESLSEPLSLDVPDYASALDKFCAARKLTQFSLHAVRLNTPFDFSLRPIYNWHKHEAFLLSIKAQMAYEHHEHQAWFWVHKQYAVSKAPMILNLRKNGLPESYLASVIECNRDASEKFNQLVFLKGSGSVNIIYNRLHARQIRYLLKNDIYSVCTPNFSMTYCSKEKLPFLKQVVDNFLSIEQQAATKIQAQFRSYQCQKFFKRYQKAHQEMELCKSKLLSMGR